mmetsp:Transcript_29803/g.53919  ORF Transcript_29803/g.53919 Transcript_29803/m.53919 type:complete len:84 (-) Transcript_29803:1310-1561(-)
MADSLKPSECGVDFDMYMHRALWRASRFHTRALLQLLGRLRIYGVVGVFACTTAQRGARGKGGFLASMEHGSVLSHYVLGAFH